MTKFYKYQSVGNDFIIIDHHIDLKGNEVKQLCNRNFGIGADGILVIRDKNITIFNSDGSLGEMCLNGLRCAIKHLVDKKNYPRESELTMGGKTIRYEVDNPLITTILDAPQYVGTKTVNGFRGHIVHAPNPHFIIFEKTTLEWLTQNGKSFQKHFPNGTNIEFVWGNYDVVIYERGCGITLGCGSGAIAIIQVLKTLKKINNNDKVKLKMPGGTITSWMDQENKVLIQSKSHLVFEGQC